jgi:hypothetical protein
MIHNKLYIILILFTLLFVKTIGQDNQMNHIDTDKVFISTGLNISTPRLGAGTQYPTQYSFLERNPDSIIQSLGIGGGVGLNYKLELCKTIDLIIGMGTVLKNLNFSLYGDSLSPAGNPDILCNNLNHRFINIYIPLSVNIKLKNFYIGFGFDILLAEKYYLRYYFDNLKVSSIRSNSYLPNTFQPTINPSLSIAYQFVKLEFLPDLFEVKYDYMKGFGHSINFNIHYRIN